MLFAALTCAALADTDIYHTPTDAQLSRKEALSKTTAFFLELTGIDLSGEFAAGNYTALFGPGYQWYVDTEEDCWVISIEFDNELTVAPHILLHGTTGEVLDWSFYDKTTKISYQCALPDETTLPLEEAIAIVRGEYAKALGLTAEEAQSTRCGASFGLYGVMTVLQDVENPELPVWEINIGDKYKQPFPMMGGYYVSAIDGTIVESSLWEDPEYRELHP